jgi:hypothetical protein
MDESRGSSPLFWVIKMPQDPISRHINQFLTPAGLGRKHVCENRTENFISIGGNDTHLNDNINTQIKELCFT